MSGRLYIATFLILLSAVSFAEVPVWSNDFFDNSTDRVGMDPSFFNRTGGLKSSRVGRYACESFWGSREELKLSAAYRKIQKYCGDNLSISNVQPKVNSAQPSPRGRNAVGYLTVCCTGKEPKRKSKWRR